MKCWGSIASWLECSVEYWYEQSPSRDLEHVLTNCSVPSTFCRMVVCALLNFQRRAMLNTVTLYCVQLMKGRTKQSVVSGTNIRINLVILSFVNF